MARGDTIAFSGNTGYTDNHPHLHFSIHACASLPGFAVVPGCPALPIVFVNAEPRPDGPLVQFQSYRAGAIVGTPPDG